MNINIPIPCLLQQENGILNLCPALVLKSAQGKLEQDKGLPQNLEDWLLVGSIGGPTA